MTTRTKGLTRGARATIYRDGTDLHSAVDIPAAGAFALRSLPPGQYVARDSCGGEQAFAVTVGQEYAVLLEGDTIGVTGEPGVSGSSEVLSHNVGRGGGVFTSPDQVAAGETVSGQVKRVEGEAPAEGDLVVPRPDRPGLRPKDPSDASRVPGAAGSAIVQDAPAHSIEALHDPDVDTSSDGEVPRFVSPDPVGPAPEESTLPPEGYGASAGNSPTPLPGRREGDPQPVLGEEPSDD